MHVEVCIMQSDRYNKHTAEQTYLDTNAVRVKALSTMSAYNKMTFTSLAKASTTHANILQKNSKISIQTEPINLGSYLLYSLGT